MNLTPYQIKGVEYIQDKKRVLLGDQMGLGKTAQAIVATESCYPILVICPKGLKSNWKREFKKWINQEALIDDIGRDYIKIVHYNGVKKNLEALMDTNWRTIILDESHNIGSSTTQRTKAILKLARNCFAEYRICLTGTPIKNRILELIPQLQFLGVFESHFGGYIKFVAKYCTKSRIYNSPGKFRMVITGTQNMKELGDELRSTCFIRRRKKEVQKELPPQRDVIIKIPIDNRGEYEVYEKGFIGLLSDDEQKAEALIRLEKMKAAVSEGKMRHVLEWIWNFTSGGGKLVVFASHRKAQKALHESIKDSVWTGAYKNSSEAIDLFKDKEEVKVIVCSLSADSEGHNLTESSDVLFVELGWTSVVHEQATGRVDRIGQTNPVTSWYLLGENTVEEKIMGIIKSKKKLIRDTIDGGKSDNKNSIIKDLIGEYKVKKESLTNPDIQQTELRI